MNTQHGSGSDDERDLICSFGIAPNGSITGLYIPENSVHRNVGNDAGEGNDNQQEGVHEDSNKPVS